MTLKVRNLQFCNSISFVRKSPKKFSSNSVDLMKCLQRAGISLELKELQDRLEETGDANAVQMELNKRLDSV